MAQSQKMNVVSTEHKKLQGTVQTLDSFQTKIDSFGEEYKDKLAVYQKAITDKDAQIQKLTDYNNKFHAELESSTKHIQEVFKLNDQLTNIVDEKNQHIEKLTVSFRSYEQVHREVTEE